MQRLVLEIVAIAQPIWCLLDLQFEICFTYKNSVKMQNANDS
ncbi:MAG: hypothetical protein RMX96_15345 [Nostoc sp. ChiSLP02]|nr:hypothetical protein [Nostoc sp. DedSLP05]MDZ8101842.1 hypothetical protein [Nostoc sp. DedSLP01]MDZ8186216.1 hypothetical protein [Nostoc sp. ChiSLP02]